MINLKVKHQIDHCVQCGERRNKHVQNHCVLQATIYECVTVACLNAFILLIAQGSIADRTPGATQFEKHEFWRVRITAKSSQRDDRMYIVCQVDPGSSSDARDVYLRTSFSIFKKFIMWWRP